MSWVALHDVVRAIAWLLVHPEFVGPVNIVSPQAVIQKEFAKALAKSINRPAFMRLPAWFVRWKFGEMGQALLLDSMCVRPKRLLDNGFTFEKGHLEDALRK